MSSAPKDLSRPGRKLGAFVVLICLSLAVWTGCGDVFRPTANPIPGPTADPRNFHIAVVVSRNSVGNPGSGMQIDVSGDSQVGVVSAGQQPLYAALLPQAARVFVSNSDGTITSFTPAAAVASIGIPTTISLPPGLTPGFLFSTESATMYAATSGSTSACSNAPNTGAVAAINATTLVVENTICVGPNPTVLTETPNGQKVYSINSDGTLSSINTADNSVNPPISSPPLTQPVGVVASLDNSEIFVLDASGVVWLINTLTDQVSVPPATAPPSSNFMALESTRNRLYVTSPGSGSGPPTLTILDASTPSLSPLNRRALPLPTGATPVMVSFLPNGTRAYVLSITAANSPLVSVIDTATNAFLNTISLPAATANPSAVTACQAPGVHPFSMAASGNSTRLYVTNCYAGSTSIIDTSSNTQVLAMNSPTSAYPPVHGSAYPPPENPVFVVTGP
ncbi:MAG: YncE family protein [Acidobacteria bacterium]|nr:YncE family protein [Acidobacteriota bacterium]